MDRLRAVVAGNPLLAISVPVSLLGMTLLLQCGWPFTAGYFLAVALAAAIELADQWIKLTRVR